jgi:ankyrin repeat protein
METKKLHSHFSLGRQSSLAPDHDDSATVNSPVTDSVTVIDLVDPTVRLMYLANEGDLEGITELLDDGSDVNFRDSDGRSALHIAACQGRTDVVELLLQRGAEVDVQDRWCSTVMQCNAIFFVCFVLVSC